MRNTRRLLAAAGALGMLALTACGPASASGSSGSAKSGEINVMAISVLQSSSLSFPDESAAMQANVDTINAAGGIGGKKINLIVCNDQFDPNVAAKCARQAASDDVAAVLEPFEPYTEQIDPILQAAGIPMVYSEFSTTTDGSSPTAFLRDAGVPGGYASLGLGLAKEGCKKIGAVVVQESNNLLGEKWLANGAKIGGVPVVQAPVTQDQADFSSPVAKLASQGADCLVPDTLPQQGAKVVSAAAQSGHRLRLGAISAEFAAPQLAALGSAANGMLLTGQNYQPSDTSVPAVKAVLDGMAKYSPKVPLQDNFGIGGWASVTGLAEVLKSVHGPVTKDSVMQAAAKASYDTGLYASFSASSPPPVSAFPRAKNWSYLTWTVQHGKPVLKSRRFIPVPAGL
ncbi:MAG: ABC transporter substrate-binding protein [Streptosporangiales bacterium]|jgi:ABC-type branched-subunit amino acid transport system substrate-binding protein|nr:ABC transporter substrate-binding protein [Streptosporangiales bacterium]